MSNKFTKESRQKLVEAQKISTETRKKNFERRVQEYEADPRLCKKCKTPLRWNQRKFSCCSHSCAASLCNIGIRRHGTSPIEHPCFMCSTVTLNEKYCCKKCQNLGRKQEIHTSIENGTYKIVTGNSILKRYLLEKRGHRCEKCGLTEWLEKPINLTVHHEDGDATNNLPSNLQLQCWNCHSMTENFGRKNTRSTRLHRYKS